MRVHRCFAVALLGGLMMASSAAAAPITFSASGQIDGVVSAFGVDMSPVAPGTTWALDVTFDGAASGVAQGFCNNTPSYVYSGAIVDTRFQIGGQSYSNSGGDIFVNADLPVSGCQSALGGPGLVQFQWTKNWLSSPGAFDLNLFLGLMIASYNDVNATTGALPTGPVPGAQGQLGGLLWNLQGGPQFWSNSFVPHLPVPAPVPEPGTFLLIGTGVAALIARRRASRRTAA